MDALHALAVSSLTLVACNAASPSPVNPPSPVASESATPVVDAPPPVPVASAPRHAEPNTPFASSPPVSSPATPKALAMPNVAEVQSAMALRCSKRGNTHGCVDKQGNVAVPFEHSRPVVFKRSGLALVLAPGGTFVFVNARNETVLEAFLFDNGPDAIVEDRARVLWEGKVGFVDSEWRLVIPPSFDAAFGFEKGRARVCIGCDPGVWSKERPSGAKEGRVFFVDRSGKPARE